MNILKKYKKQKKLSNLTIIWLSLVIAFWVNFFVLDKTNISNNLKANILEKEQKNNIWDLFLEKKDNYLVLKTNKNINNIDNLSLSFAYNPENIEIKEIIPKLNSEILDISNTPWIKTIIIQYKSNYTINSFEEILKIKYSKKENKTENLNIINANFTDSSSEIYELSTSWIAF